MPPLTLDDVAALLVSLEPTDRGEFARPRDELRRHADDATLSDAARRFARDAADRLDAALKPRVAKAKRAALLAEAARLVGAAIIAGEAFEFDSAAELPDD